MKNTFFFKRKKNGSDDSKNLKKNVKRNQEISSEEDFSDQDARYSGESSDEETAQEKRLRIAKQCISKLEDEERERNAPDATEAVAKRLKDKCLEEAGRFIKKRAHKFINVAPEPAVVLREHKLSITSLVVSPCGKYFFTGSKDSCIIKWDLIEKKKLQMIKYVKKGTDGPGHTHPVLALAISSDGKFLASGCEGNMVKIWDGESLELLKTFTAHKGAITGLTFLRGTHNLISTSKDRSLKVWDLDEMGYVETLFGHQDEVAGIDCLGESVMTCGSRDGTVRLWKIAEESQLVYIGDGGSIDCIATSSFKSFVTGGEDGTLRLWSTRKKKPRSKIEETHGMDEESEAPNWIVALTRLENSDLIASGSKDGFVRLWRQDDETHCLVPVSSIPVTGFVNCLQFSPSGKQLIVGVGQEHRLGRWWRLNEAKNSVVIFEF